jgi:NADPH:quinone reductase
MWKQTSCIQLGVDMITSRMCVTSSLDRNSRKTMKAAYILGTGGPEVIQYGELPDPSLGGNQVLVQVAAVSVNPIDTYIRNGANFWPLPSPFVIGCDFAGTVVGCGAQVKHVAVGDRVWGSNQGLLGRQGCFSELAAIDSEWVYLSPSSVTDQDAAASALVGITAHLGLFREGNLKAGQTVFVRGGTGGVGAMVVQMAKAIGATVITTAGSTEKAKRCYELGADHVIQYKTENTTDEILKYSQNGVDLFWETLRDPDLDQAVTTMAERGTMIVMAGRTARPALPLGPFYVKGCSLRGFAMFKASNVWQQQTFKSGGPKENYAHKSIVSCPSPKRQRLIDCKKQTQSLAAALFREKLS